MAYDARKTEHFGPKHGSGAYWGRKVAAKHQSKRKRRAADKEIVREKTTDQQGDEGDSTQVPEDCQ